MTTRDELEKDDDFVRGYHDIPYEDDLRNMSFVHLVSLLATCQKDSPKFTVVEREIKRHLAKDQAKINLPNMLWAACLGGVFALAGVVLGYYLKNDVAPPSTMQQTENGNLGVSPPDTNITPSAPPVAQPTNNPEPIQNNAKKSDHNP